MVSTNAYGLSKADLLVAENAFASSGGGIIHSGITRFAEESTWCSCVEVAFCEMLECDWIGGGDVHTGSGSSKYSGQTQCKEREQKSLHREIK